MQTFGEQLCKVRKERRITQDQLANMMNISRTTVSRWETGRALPDIETIKQLSHMLDYNFFAVDEIVDSLNEEVAAELQKSFSESTEAKAVPVTDSSRKALEKPGRSPLWQIILSFLLGVMCAVVVMLLLRPAQVSDGMKQVVATSTEAKRYSAEWFATAAPNEEGKAYLKIRPLENPVRGKHTAPFTPECAGWIWSFMMTEENDIPFYPTSASVYIFDLAGNAEPLDCTKEELEKLFGDGKIVKGETEWYSGGFPVQGISGVGLLIEGTDEKGNELTFRGYVELSQEIIPLN